MYDARCTMCNVERTAFNARRAGRKARGVMRSAQCNMQISAMRCGMVRCGTMRYDVARYVVMRWR
eukprot:4153920-Lingulodinium_polyedra.AAC.1